MTLTYADLSDLTTGNRDPVRVGEIPFGIARQLNLRNYGVYLSRYSLGHILKSHPDITAYHLLHIPFVLRHGLIVQEKIKPHCLVASYYVTDEKNRYMAALKITEKGTEIWVTTFHRAHVRQTRRMIEKGIILKTHD